jgi:hypothetical protein
VRPRRHDIAGLTALDWHDRMTRLTNHGWESGVLRQGESGLLLRGWW